MSLLIVDVAVYSAADPEASALLVEDGVVAWHGPLATAAALFAGTPRLDAAGCLVTPSFVDALPGKAPRTEQDDAALGITDRVEDCDSPLLRLAPHQGLDHSLLELSRMGRAFAFGSHGAAVSPWEWVRAAAVDPPPEERISVRAAFLAATRGGRRLLGQPHPGSLVPGAPADLVVWEPWDLTVRGNDERIQTWSTDPRSRTPMLPDLSTSETPRPWLTLKHGRIVADAGQLTIPVGAR